MWLVANVLDSPWTQILRSNLNHITLSKLSKFSIGEALSMIYPGAQFFSICGPMNWKKFLAPKKQWWHRHEITTIAILVQHGRKMEGQKEPPVLCIYKSSQDNSIKFQALGIIIWFAAPLSGFMLCLLGPLALDSSWKVACVLQSNSFIFIIESKGLATVFHFVLFL